MRPVTIPTKSKRMSGPEEEFAWLLEQRKRTGEIVDYVFEGLTFRLADRTTYTPDFLIVHSDYFELVDVKARGIARLVRAKMRKEYKKQWSSKRDDAAVKIKVAAALFPWMRWAYYFREADGGWIREEIL